MTNRGQGRIFQRGSFLWVAYYSHGSEEREVAPHVRTGEKLEVSEKNRHEAERFLKRRLGDWQRSSTAAARLSARNKSASQSISFSTASKATTNFGTNGVSKPLRM